MINIITDSTADLGDELAAKYGISIVPLTVSIGGKSYRDGIDLLPPQLFKLVAQNGMLPTTAAPSVGEFYQAFNCPGESLYIGISSQLSASVANARLAARELPEGKVRVIDSLNVCIGTGVQVLRAAELRDKGLSAAEIEREITGMVPKVRIQFVVNTLEYLHKGGRCSAVQAMLGSILKINPAIEARPDGTLGVKEKIRGSRKKIHQALLKNFTEHLPEIDLQRVIVAHSGCLDEAEYLCSEVKKIAAPADILVLEAGCVISSHCGPGTICLLYTVN